MQGNLKPPSMINLSSWGEQASYPRVRIKIDEPEDLKMLVESITPLIDRGMKVSAQQMLEKFGLKAPDEDDELLSPEGSLTPVYPNSDTSVAMNRLAMNRTQPQLDADIDVMLDDTLNEWEEVGGHDFMEPILSLAQSVNSFEDFQKQLPALQAKLGSDVFVEQLAKLTFAARSLGDAYDA